MSLGIAIRGTEGVILAADSRVTLFAQVLAQGPQAPQVPMLIPSTFDHATKLLRVKNENQKHVAAVTFGAGAIGLSQPRTARSFMPEFEREVESDPRLGVREFADKLSGFFLGNGQRAIWDRTLARYLIWFFLLGVTTLGTLTEPY